MKAGDADDFDTNTVTTLVKHSAGVELHKESADDVTEPDAGTTYPLTFTVTNTGNAADVIYINTTGAPSGYPVQLFKADGVTPLALQDGKYSVGSLAEGASINIVVKVTIPAGTPHGEEGFELITTAISKADSAEKDLQTVQFGDVNGAAVTVTTEGPGASFEDPQKGNPGETVEVKVKITNDGPADDIYDLDYTDIPAGAIVEFFDKDGNPISSIPVPGDGGEETVKVRVTIPEGTDPGPFVEDPADSGKITATSTNNPSDKDAGGSTEIYIEVNEHISFTVAPDRVGAVNQGSFAEFEFTITNNSNTGDGQFQLSLPDDGKKLVYQILTASPVSVPSGESVKVKVRVEADYTANPGWTESVQLVASYEGADRLATLTMTVVGSELSLEKNVDEETAKPGDTITYTVIATNISVGRLKEVFIYDAIPEHTVYVGSALENADGDPVAATQRYSIDGGSNFGENAPNDLADITNIHYELTNDLVVNESVILTLTVKVK